MNTLLVVIIYSLIDIFNQFAWSPIKWTLGIDLIDLVHKYFVPVR